LADNVVENFLSPAEIVASAPSLPSQKTRSIYLFVRRVLDVTLSAVLMVIFLPVFTAIVLWIQLDSPGPPFFRQVRVGRRGSAFTILKFRTMVTQAPIYSYKVPISDARITRAGRWLRRSGFDELPQLWNVFRGDMSLIGPRPELPFIVAHYDGWNHPRHSLRPGITGWWQIHHRNEVPMHLNLEYDVYYVEHLSPRLDWQIVRATIGLMAKGAVKRR